MTKTTRNGPFLGTILSALAIDAGGLRRSAHERRSLLPFGGALSS